MGVSGQLHNEWSDRAESDGLFAIALAVITLNDTIAGLRLDHPLQGETLDGISGALDRIGEALEGVEVDRIEDILGRITSLEKRSDKK
jgi:hypothetical protein